MIELLINNTAAVLPDGFSMELIYRSEERRVGNECRL